MVSRGDNQIGIHLSHPNCTMHIALGDGEGNSHVPNSQNMYKG